MAIDDIVNIQISRQTSSVSKAGFGIMHVLGTHRVFSDLVREYSNTTAMTQDGFTAADPEMQAATAYFAQTQNGTPIKVIIGRRAVNSSNMTFKVMSVIGQVQGVTINGTAFNFTSATGSETAAAVMAAVLGLVNGGSEPVTAVDLSSGGTLSTDEMALNSDVAGAGDTIVVSVESTASVEPTLRHINVNPLAIDDVNAIVVQNNDWYGIVFHDHRRAFVRALMTATAGAEVFGLKVNTTDFEFTSSGVEGPLHLAKKMEELINLGSEPVIAFANYDGTIDVYDDGTSDNVVNTVIDSDNNVNANSFTAMDPVIDLATGVEAMKKLFGTSSSDATAIEITDASDVLSNAKRIDEAGYARTYYLHDLEAETAFPEAAWMGNLFPTDPGSATWKFKKLATITSENLTETNRTNLLAKNANAYLEVGGVDITCDGTVGEGEYIDVIRGVDWLDARMTERIFSRLVTLPKVAYTDEDLAIIEAEIRAQLDEGIAAGFLANDPANHNGQPYTVTMPLVENVSSVDKANRSLFNVTFSATLAGALHAITVQGTVTI